MIIHNLFLYNITAVAFDTEAALINYWKNNENLDSLWAGVVFTSDTTGTTTDLSYKLRVALRKGSEDDDRWRTELTYPFFTAFGYRNNESTNEEPCKYH